MEITLNTMVFILFQGQLQTTMPHRNSTMAVAKERMRSGQGGAFFSLQPRTERPEWRNKASLDSQSNPLESTEDKNSCDPILVFKIESSKKIYQLKPLLYSNILALTCQLLR